MPTTDKRPLKVFLCHAHADRDAVRALYARLTKDGVDAWLDKEKLLPGQDWELEIRKAVREADVVVVCLSKQFNQAGFRQKEVHLALDTAMEQPEGEIFIVPARLDECENLESLRNFHIVSLFKKGEYKRLLMALGVRAEKRGAKPPIIQKVSKKKKTVILDLVEEEKITGTTQIALIGKPGVGKSKTFNNLFDPAPNFPDGYFEKIRWNGGLLKGIAFSFGERGLINVINFPSPDDINFIDSSRLAMYQDRISKCSMILWLIKITDLEFDASPLFIEYISTKISNLVVGINQVDLGLPGEWSDEFNLPSKELDKYIKSCEKKVRNTLKSLGINPFAIVSYSALRRYHLVQLFSNMLNACPPKHV